MQVPLVLYGSTAMCIVELERIKSAGLVPVCIVEPEETPVTSRNDSFEIPVLSLHDVIKKYNEFSVYVLPKQELIVFDFLEGQGIAKSRILNYKYERELSLGCSQLNGNFMVAEKIKICCKTDNSINISPRCDWVNCTNGIDMEASITRFLEMKNRLMQSIQLGQESECTGCGQIKYDFYPVDKKIKELLIGFDGPCQLSCLYCRLTDIRKKRTGYYTTDEEKRILHNFDWEGLIGNLEKRHLLSEEAVIHIAAGEITITPRKEELYNSVKNYKVVVATNAIKYDNQISKLTSRDGSLLVISVDAGTRDTYKHLKGLDAFDLVWDNITSYASFGSNIHIKYVFTLENSNSDDVEGYINKVIDAGVKVVLITVDYLRKMPITDEQGKGIAKMFNLAKKIGITPFLGESLFSAEELDKIRKHLEV